MRLRRNTRALAELFALERELLDSPHPLPAALWFARNTRQRDELAALCDAIADGLPLELDLAPGA